MQNKTPAVSQILINNQIITKQLNLNVSPVIEQILYSNFSVVLENTTVNNAIATFTNHILISKPIGRYFELPQSIPMAPPQVRHLRHSNGGRLVTRPRLSTAVPRPAARTNTLRVRNSVALPYLDVNSLLPTGAMALVLQKVRLRHRVGCGSRQKHGLFWMGSGGVNPDFLNLLGGVGDFGILVSEKSGSRLLAAVTAGGEPEGDEKENEHNCSSDTDTQNDP